MKLREGNIFRSVCHSVHRRGGGAGWGHVWLGGGICGWGGVCMAGGHAWAPIRLASGRYVSYWNANLFLSQLFAGTRCTIMVSCTRLRDFFWNFMSCSDLAKSILSHVTESFECRL